MKVTRWTNWDDDRYGDASEEENFDEMLDVVAEDIKEHGYKINGWSHQNYEYGCPVIDDKYLVAVSFRKWGAIMCKAYAIDDDDEYGYVKWAWASPKDEDEVLPKEED